MGEPAKGRADNWTKWTDWTSSVQRRGACDAPTRSAPYRPFADTPSRLIIPPSSLHFPRRRFLFGGRLWRRGRFNNSGVQEFPRAVHHRCKIEFSVQISEIYCSHADNLQLSVGKPLCRLISWRSYFAQLCRWHTVSFRQIRLQGIDIIIEKPDHFHAGS